jgi:uncharacterized protein (TIGR00725 family)
MSAGAVVAVVGPGSRDADVRDLAQAYEVGKRLAGRGFAVLTGGRDGVMAEAARGVRDADGLAVGLLPGTDRAAGNEFLALAVPTGLGQLRNGLLVNASDAVLAVGCSWGTLSEICLAQRVGKALVCLRPWQLLDAAGRDVPLPTAADPEDAVRMIASLLPAEQPG